MFRSLLVCVCQRNQCRFAECAAGERHAERRRINHWSTRWHESAGNDNARITRFRWGRRTAILWKENRIEIVIRTLNSVRTIEDRIQPASCECQVKGTIREVSLRVCTTRAD